MARLSDIIESFLKGLIIEEEGAVEIQRNELANRFNCVPSQINYVIKTRFTIQNGYLVRSKRGGGGYIRIFKIQVVDEIDQINQMIALIGKRISQRNGVNMVKTLIQSEIITEREGTLMLSVIEKSVLHSISEQEQQARALLLKTFLVQLRYTLK